MNKTNKRNETATATNARVYARVYTNVDNGNIIISQTARNNEYYHTMIGKASSVEEDFINKTIRHYGAATPVNLMKEAENTVRLQQEVELAESQYKHACKIAGIATEEDRLKEQTKKEVVKNIANCIAAAAIFVSGVMTAKKYFNKK